MVELLTKQQIRNVAQRQFNTIKEEDKVTKNMACIYTIMILKKYSNHLLLVELLKKSFPDKP
ncbi:unnamed protein product, partial [Rotaria magnacalcarata]